MVTIKPLQTTLANFQPKHEALGTFTTKPLTVHKTFAQYQAEKLQAEIEAHNAHVREIEKAVQALNAKLACKKTQHVAALHAKALKRAEKQRLAIEALPKAGGLRLIGVAELRQQLIAANTPQTVESPETKRVAPVSKSHNQYSVPSVSKEIFNTKADCLRAMSKLGFTHYALEHDGKAAIIPKAYRTR